MRTFDTYNRDFIVITRAFFDLFVLCKTCFSRGKLNYYDARNFLLPRSNQDRNFSLPRVVCLQDNGTVHQIRVSVVKSRWTFASQLFYSHTHESMH